jgi:hypothetical protein
MRSPFCRCAATVLKRDDGPVSSQETENRESAFYWKRHLEHEDGAIFGCIGCAGELCATALSCSVILLKEREFHEPL